MAFYGESYATDQVNNVTGSAASSYLDIFYHFDDRSAPMAAGDSFIVGAFADPAVFDDLVDAGDVVVSWVIETGSTSAGTLSLASGLDPDWDCVNPALATEALGSQTATGEQTLVFGPVAGITLADLIAFDAEPLVLIECTSGSVDILQVKLRVWPATGPAGAWSPTPAASYTRTDGSSRWETDAQSFGSPQVPTYAEAWEIARDEVDSLTEATWRNVASTSSTMRFDLNHSVTVEPFQPFAGGDVKISLIIGASGAVVTTAQTGVMAGFDPRETRYEPTSRVRAVGGGPLLTVFESWPETATAHIDGVGGYGLRAIPAPTMTALGGGAYSGPAFSLAVDSLTMAAGAEEFSLQLDEQAQILVVFATNYFEAPAGDSLSSVTGGIPNSQSIVRIPEYEYFDPGLPWDEGLTPRFYVKDLAGVMRPVGFGKPADEAAVFRVPTAQGRFRDLTTAEYATYGPDSRPSGGYPLKVKRVDTAGETWWDHVAWLVPDES